MEFSLHALSFNLNICSTLGNGFYRCQNINHKSNHDGSQRKGRLQSLDWTGGLDRWTELDWNGLDSTQLKVPATILQLLESGYLLTYLCNLTQSCILLPSSACPYR